MMCPKIGINAGLPYKNNKQDDIIWYNNMKEQGSHGDLMGIQRNVQPTFEDMFGLWKNGGKL